MLRLLGPTRVTGIEGRGLPQAAFLAVAMLDLAPGRTLTREALATRLWEGAKAGASLRTLFKRIREWEARAGVAVLTATATSVTRDHTSLPSDLTQFLAIETVNTAAELRLYSETYGGDFLTGFEEASGVAAQWINSQRAWLRDRFLTVALAGAQRVGGTIAIEILRRLIEEEPFDDAIVRAAMVASRQDPGEVRRIYDRFVERLRDDDPGTEPEAGTEALLRELNDRAPAAARVRIDEPAPGVAASLDSVPRVLILPPGDSIVSAEERRLGEALIDEVTHTLGRLRTFAVFAPHTARAIAGSPFPSGNPYGADYLVKTRFIPGQPGNRLSVSLTRLDTYEMLLAEDLHFAAETLNAHHFQLAAAIGSRLAHGIEKSEQRIYRTTGSASAYVHYVLGCEDIRSVDLRLVRRAKAHFRQALKLSPDFAPARSMLARAMSVEWLLLDRNERDRIEKAIALAREASVLDPMDPSTHRELGHALIYVHAVDEAVESLRSAAQLGPHDADVLFTYGDALVHHGSLHEARRVMDKALSLNPLAPDLYYWVSASADYFMGNYAAASDMAKRMLNREPAARFIAAVEAMNGNLEEAARHRDIYLAAHPDFRVEDYIFPFNPGQKQHYFEGLRRAGFV